MKANALTAAEATSALTVGAVAVLVYFFATVIHEVIGHGLVCTVVRGKVLAISSVHCACDYQGIGRTGERLVQAGGTLANLTVGLLAFTLLATVRDLSPTWRYVLWLTAVVNLLQGGGYLMISPFGGFGDWHGFLDGITRATAWKVALTAAGLAITLVTIYVGLAQLDALSGAPGPARNRQAWVLTALPYVVGALVACSIALVNPVNRGLVFGSAAAATLGGTCCLLWLGLLTVVSGSSRTSASIPVPWNPALVIGAVVAIGVWALLLGPGITFATMRR